MTGTDLRPIGVDQARDLAQALLGAGSERWRHSAGVARRAEELAGTVADADRELLVSAAWLHDIGYAGLAHATGFHPLDGARYLDRHGWPARVSALVAHHSGACFVAVARGFGAALTGYPDERSAVSDALAYADQTVGPFGLRVTMAERFAEALRRHGPGSPNAAVRHLREPYLLDVADRVERRLRHRPPG